MHAKVDNQNQKIETSLHWDTYSVLDEQLLRNFRDVDKLLKVVHPNDKYAIIHPSTGTDTLVLHVPKHVNIKFENNYHLARAKERPEYHERHPHRDGS